MKLAILLSPSRRPAARTVAKGFTLTELLIAVTVFLLVVTAVLSANLFGLRIFQIAENKLTATDSVRKTVGKITDEIRNCSSTYVGNISNGVFVALSTGVPQTGSGLLIYPTTNTANFIIYFFNASDQTFRRTTSPPGATTILARAVTNTLVFSAQDCLGNVLTNSQNNRVIQMNLAFFQGPRFGVTPDCYQVETAVTRRAL